MHNGGISFEMGGKMEQTGYLQEKKAKRKKGRALRSIVLLLLLAAAAGIFYCQKRQQAEEENPNAEETITLEKDQSWLYLEIEEITGNEIQAVKVSDNAPEAEGALQTYTIPVGTDVVTKLGSVTTFSRLAAGDTIHCLMQEEDGEAVILKIWIEE